MLSFYWIVSGSTTLEKWSDYRKCSQGLHESHPCRFSWRSDNDSLHAQSHFTSLLRKYFLFLKHEYLHVSKLIWFFFRNFEIFFQRSWLKCWLTISACWSLASPERLSIRPSASFTFSFKFSPLWKVQNFAKKLSIPCVKWLRIVNDISVWRPGRNFFLYLTGCR